MNTITPDTDLKEKIAGIFETITDRDNSNRKEALSDFQKIGLPGNKTEEYRFTPITKLLEKDLILINPIQLHQQLLQLTNS